MHSEILQSESKRALKLEASGPIQINFGDAFWNIKIYHLHNTRKIVLFYLFFLLLFQTQGYPTNKRNCPITE